jgi:Leucine-rich repeat (LRR) protein
LWERGFVKRVGIGLIDNPEELSKLASVPTVEELVVWQIEDSTFRCLPTLPNLRTLEFDVNRGAVLGEESIACIASCRTLRKLQCLPGWSVRDGGLHSFVKLTELRELSIRGSQVTDNSLRHLVGMTRLEALGLSNTDVSGEGLAVVAKLPRMRQLSLNSSRLTEAAIDPLIACRNLQYLRFSNSDSSSTSSGVGDRLLAALPQLPELLALHVDSHCVSETGFRELGYLGNLEELLVGGTHFGDAELTHLRSLVHLRRLVLDYANVTAIGLATLRDLPNLRVLTLGRVAPHRLPAGALQAIASLTQLQWLKIPITATDDELAHLAGMPNLEVLDLNCSKATDSGLARLKEMPQLRVLHAWGTDITKAAAWDRRAEWAPNLEAVRLDGVEIGPILRKWEDY